MNFFAYASLLCFLSVRPILGAHYEIMNITANPGLCYERVQTVKIRKGGWKVIIYIDLLTFLWTHGPVRQYEEYLQHCTSQFDRQQCHLFLNQDSMELKLRTLDGIHEEIKMAAEAWTQENPIHHC